MLANRRKGKGGRDGEKIDVFGNNALLGAGRRTIGKMRKLWR